MRVCCLLGWLLVTSAWVVQARPPETDFDTVIAALKEQGTWQESKTYQYLFQPKGASGWLPYRNGQWIYTDYGWTWRGADPNSWILDHYGSWTKQDTGGNWAWAPDTFWLPATVEWLKCGDYIGWRPSKLDRFSNPEEQQTARYSDPNEWNFIPLAKLGDRLTPADFVSPERAKDLLINAEPADHVFISYRKIERPGPDPALLVKEPGKPGPVIPVVSDLQNLTDTAPAEATAKEYYTYRPSFYQSNEGVMRRIKTFLNPDIQQQNKASMQQLTKEDPAAQQKALEATKRQEERMELERKHEQDLYR